MNSKKNIEIVKIANDFTKKDLKESIKLINTFKINEYDYEDILNKAGKTLKDYKIAAVLEKCYNLPNIEKNDDLVVIMEKVTEYISLEDLKIAAKRVFKNKDFMRFILHEWLLDQLHGRDNCYVKEKERTVKIEVALVLLLALTPLGFIRIQIK